MKKTIKHFLFLTALVALFALLSVAAFADEPAPSIDMGLVFTSETQLTVYVDGEWSPALSNTYGFGDKATITAPEKSGSKTFSHWTADGSIVSYGRTLNLTMNAHTTLYAVYASAAPTTKPVAGFTSITRTNDGNSISFQAIASSKTAGIVYSTTATGDALMIGGNDVENVAAETLTDSTTTLPASIMDDNNCWMLQITPTDKDMVYHARAYVTVSGTTTYGDVKSVKLSDLESGVSLIANLEGFKPGTNDKLAGLTDGMHTVTYDANGGVGATMVQAFKGTSVKLRANTFTREGYTFNGWSTNQNGGGTTYTDGQTVTLNDNTTLYAQWRSNSSGGNPGSGGTITYIPTINETKNGTVTVDPKAAASGTKVTITPKPDEGYEVDTVTVTDASGKAVEVTKNADGSYSFTQPSGKVTISATFKKIADPDANCPMKAFTDLDPKAWYHDGVHWALENGVMNGVGGGKFDPNGTTTRGMIVTILYRLEGSPAVTAANPFDDVAAGQWYTDAVLWAAENKIVSGYGDGKFGPDDAITREQLAAILYRYAQTKGEGFQGLWSFKLDFPDSGDVSDWATEAVSWMVMNGVINGKDGKLVPGGNATRAEAATMLQRFCEFLAK